MMDSRIVRTLFKPAKNAELASFSIWPAKAWSLTMIAAISLIELFSSAIFLCSS
jgi:hypothetical protein